MRSLLSSRFAGLGLSVAVAAFLCAPAWLARRSDTATHQVAKESARDRVVLGGAIADTRPAGRPQPSGHQSVKSGLGKIEAFAPYSILKDFDKPLPERIRAIAPVLERAGGGEIELAEIMRFYASPVLDDANAKERERALRNSLLNEMRALGLGTTHVILDLANGYRNEQVDPGLRDYALQHLAAWVPGLSGVSRQAALDALFEALAVREGTYAGTALLGLIDVQRRTSFIEPSRNFDSSRVIEAMIANPAVDVKNRLTAMALASELSISKPEIANAAREWTSATGMPVGAQRAASAYLKFYNNN